MHIRHNTNNNYEEHPIVKIVYNLTWEFKNIFTTKSVENLDHCIKKIKNTNIQEFKSFTNGLARDIEAVRNAVTYENNNGLAEGSINKLKLIKRIMYGRYKFSTLRTKILLLERMRLFN
nr:transposase [Bacillus thuringiensis]